MRMKKILISLIIVFALQQFPLTAQNNPGFMVGPIIGPMSAGVDSFFVYLTGATNPPTNLSDLMVTANHPNIGNVKSKIVGGGSSICVTFDIVPRLIGTKKVIDSYQTNLTVNVFNMRNTSALNVNLPFLSPFSVYTYFQTVVCDNYTVIGHVNYDTIAIYGGNAPYSVDTTVNVVNENQRVAIPMLSYGDTKTIYVQPNGDPFWYASTINASHFLFDVQGSIITATPPQLCNGSIYQYINPYYANDTDRYAYQWFDANMKTIILNSDIGKNLCPGTYILRKTSKQYGCYVDVSNTVPDLTTGLQSIAKEGHNITLSPNPVIDILHINIQPALPEQLSIVLYNALGQVVAQVIENDKKFSLDMTGLNGGLYFYSIYYGNEILKSGKLIKH